MRLNVPAAALHRRRLADAGGHYGGAGVLPGILWPSLEPVLLAGLTVAGSLSLSRCNRDRARDLPRMHRDLSLWQLSRRSAHREREKRELNAMRTLIVRDLLE